MSNMKVHRTASASIIKAQDRGRFLVAAASLSLFIAVGGCTLAPEYIRPDAPIPNVYPVGDAEGTGAMKPWREFFQDPGMQRAIGLALEHNRDLRIAMLNIEKTRAQYHIQATDLLPTINAVGSGSIQDLPSDMGTPGGPKISRQYSASLGFSGFELDLFGRIRSLTAAAQESYYSVQNDAQTARLSLVAEVAGMYLQMIADREIYDLTESTYENRKKNYETVKRRQENGIASMLEVQQARTGMEEARTTLAALRTRVAQDENYLALLMGTPVPSDLADARSLQRVLSLADVPAGLPSTLLERRPDIEAAEHRLQAANANIGAARANFFPRISLTGALGTLSLDYDKLFTGSQGTWSFLPQASIPLFDTGRNIGQLRVSEAEKGIAVATYEKTIQSAFREVADALAQRTNMAEQLAAQESLLDATKKAYILAETRYSVGVDNQLTMLEAQRSLYAAQQGYINTKLLRESTALTLYKTLGGGWF